MLRAQTSCFYGWFSPHPFFRRIARARSDNAEIGASQLSGVEASDPPFLVRLHWAHMPSFTIKLPHRLPTENAKTRITTLAHCIAEEFGVNFGWRHRARRASTDEVSMAQSSSNPSSFSSISCSRFISRLSKEDSSERSPTSSAARLPRPLRATPSSRCSLGRVTRAGASHARRPTHSTTTWQGLVATFSASSSSTAISARPCTLALRYLMIESTRSLSSGIQQGLADQLLSESEVAFSSVEQVGTPNVHAAERVGCFRTRPVTCSRALSGGDAGL